MTKRIWPAAALAGLPVAAAMAFVAQKPSAPSSPAPSSAVEYRLTTVDHATIAAAIDKARAEIARRKGANVVIRLPAGTFEISQPGAEDGASIDVSRIDACPGALTIAGAGDRRTTLVSSDRVVGILGRDTRCVTIADLTMTQRRPEMSQGTIVSASGDQIVIDIPKGFPTPAQLMPYEREIGRNGQEVVRRWVRTFTPAPDGPHIVESQPQAAWLDATKVAGAPDRWRLTLRTRRGAPPYRAGDLVGLKSKSGRDAYRFMGGDHITMRGVRWTMETRGIFRRVEHVTIEDCSIERPPPINGVKWAMASSAGGPQIGHPADPVTSGHVVTNNRFDAPGDDAIMFAHASGVATNNRITDSFGRSIMIYESPGLKLSGNTAMRAPILRMKDGSLNRPNPTVRVERADTPANGVDDE